MKTPRRLATWLNGFSAQHAGVVTPRDVIGEIDAIDARTNGLPQHSIGLTSVQGLSPDFWYETEVLAAELAEVYFVGRPIAIAGHTYTVEFELNLGLGIHPTLDCSQSMVRGLTLDGKSIRRVSPNEPRLEEQDRASQRALQFRHDFHQLLEIMHTDVTRNVHSEWREVAVRGAQSIGMQLVPLQEDRLSWSKRGLMRSIVNRALAESANVSNVGDNFWPAVITSLAVVAENDSQLRSREVDVICQLARQLSDVPNTYPDMNVDRAEYKRPRNRDMTLFFDSHDVEQSVASEARVQRRDAWRLDGFPWPYEAKANGWREWTARENWIAAAKTACTELATTLRPIGPTSLQQVREQVERGGLRSVEDTIGQTRVLRDLSVTHATWINRVAVEGTDKILRATGGADFSVSIDGVTYRPNPYDNHKSILVTRGKGTESSIQSIETALVFVKALPRLLTALDYQHEVHNDIREGRQATLSAQLEIMSGPQLDRRTLPNDSIGF